MPVHCIWYHHPWINSKVSMSLVCMYVFGTKLDVTSAINHLNSCHRGGVGESNLKEIKVIKKSNSDQIDRQIYIWFLLPCLLKTRSFGHECHSVMQQLITIARSIYMYCSMCVYIYLYRCTLPSGYTYDLDPEVSQRIIEDFNSMMVDEAMDFNQLPDLMPSNQVRP